MSIRTNAYNIFINDTDKAKLQNVIAGVIDNYEKKTLSYLLKNQTGTPMGAGSMSFKRFANAVSQAYGTARTALKGNNLIVPETVVNLDQKKEIIEEVNKFDLETFGIGGIADRRKANYQSSLRRELERQFFRVALTQGTLGAAIDTANIESSIEAKIQVLETLSNDFVDGVERDQMALVLKPSVFGALKLKLNDIRNTDFVRVEGEEIKAFNGVATFSSTYLPANVDGVLMVRGSVAQPVNIDEYDLEKINLSNDWALQLFYDYGVKALASDLILTFVTGALAATTMTVVSTLPATGVAGTLYIVSGTGLMFTWDATDTEYVAYTGTMPA